MFSFFLFLSMKPKHAAKYLVVSIAVISSGLLYLQWSPSASQSEKYFDHGHLRSMLLDSLYQGENDMFASAGTCDHCHGADPTGVANVDFFGNDVNVVDDWSSSMMANSAKDPYWRAKVSHEVLTNPAHQAELESVCTTCHAPMGKYAAESLGQDHYSIAEMVEDSVALDGVSCLACHRQTPQPEVALHTGRMFFDPNKMAYGPYTSPLITPMALSSGYTPEHGAHINDSKLCAACHSLVTQTVDLAGEATGAEFVEQATWHEWLNSQYPAQGISCQGCHVPRLPKQSVRIATGYNTPPREPYGLHELVGGNAFMLALLKDNREELGIAATEAAFDETISKTITNLQNNSITIQVNEEDRDADSVYFNVLLTNLTGHKMPSGYPARRMSMHVTVRDASNGVLWQSGGFDNDYYINGEDDQFEPHHTHIRNEDDVQIYEMVMGDVNGNRTIILERGASHLKDNRLTPKGHSSTHPQADTTEIVLNVEDPDFNNDPTEGTGSDRTYYRVPLDGYAGELTVTVEVYYQSVPPNWAMPMFDANTPEIETFEAMYNAADKAPVLMKSSEIAFEEFINVDEKDQRFGTIQWNAIQHMLTIQSQEKANVYLYDAHGKMIRQWKANVGTESMQHNLVRGTYIVRMVSETGKTMVRKIVA